ncbi:long-chain fatty acid--CoA ligase [Herbiconiux sp. L3-i23]|uniref:AMP-dependent synthetase/ligase n=1 Tax=Herbiconiux sp. L3-i23 TaxID=2905871 RepID=UPI00206FC43A|nr:AMP-dependent synthetase/ligase [Herbiconiux sp. L3-i23]BDI22868.1 long-chain-fatty-acid--CoA ligase [Herbiconiux sp. L3-i23]
MPEELRETWTPGYGTATAAMSLCSVVLERARSRPGSTLAEIKGDDGGFVPVTAQRFLDDVLATARGFVALGVEPGDRVGVMANTRYEWSVLDVAGLFAGAVTVPVYQTSSADQLAWIVTDSALKVLVTENRTMAALADALLESSPLERVLVLEDSPGALAELRTAGAEIDEEVVLERAAAADLDTLATIVYTSGTTGRPKGVELTHGNFVTHIVNGVDDPNLGGVVKGEDKRTLLFLPLSHVFGRFINYLCMYSGSVIGYTPSTKTLVADLQAFRPTWLLAVPRVFETFYNSANALSGTGVKQRIFQWASKTAQAYSRSLDTGGPSPVLAARMKVADRLVFQKIRAVMGGQVTYAISGGAPLAVWLGHFFRGIGITVMEGYGLTELSAPTAVNRPGLIKIGSVGAPYPGTGVHIADDGEILVKGPNVFRGYRGDPDATASEFVDGWFATGDYGRLDSDGYLYIVGRKKEIIITAGGKNVQPAGLENLLRSHPIISEVVVVGDEKPFIGALIALDEAMLEGWLKSKGRPALSLADAANDETVRAALDEEIARANQSVSRAEGIRKYVILPRALSEEQGELSASLKVRRKVVLEHFADEFDSLYR